MAGLLTEKIRASQQKKGLLDLWKGLLGETGLPELFSGRIGGQTLEQGIQNRLQPNSLRPALSPQQMVEAGLNIAGVAPVGMFIGKGAKTWDAIKASEAMQMEKAGKPPREIWAQTGNWKGPDGQWRQEIPDNLAIVKSTRGGGGKEKVLGDMLEHELLYEAYPDIKNVKAGWDTKSDYSLYSAKHKDIPEYFAITGKGKGGLKNSAGHEVQHKIQHDEGFATGGTWNEFYNAKDYIAANKRIDEIREMTRYKTSPFWDQYNKEYSDYVAASHKGKAAEKLELSKPTLLAEEMELQRKLYNELNPFKRYLRLAGEAEARATQARMNMDMQQRLATFPEDSFDVPMDQLIVRYGDGPSMSTSRPVNHLGQPIHPTKSDLLAGIAPYAAPFGAGLLGSMYLLPPDEQ